jgi:hypothetical protein
VQLVALMYVGVGQLTVTAHGEESGEERVHDFTVRIIRGGAKVVPINANSRGSITTHACQCQLMWQHRYQYQR